MRILLIEDELAAARGMSVILKAKDTMVDHAETGEDGLEFARRYDYDIIILDVMLPDIQGFEVTRRLRAAHNDTPILILSGLTGPAARVKCLALGADDFLTKPFDRDELLARIDAVARRCRRASQSIVRIGPLRLNIDTSEVTIGGRLIELTCKEYSILEQLALRRGTVQTKEAFLNSLYGGKDEPEGKIIDVFVCKLRKKLALAGADNIIHTIWGRGYTIDEPSSAHPDELPPRQHLPVHAEPYLLSAA